MKYSFIIPVFNRPEEVGELLESLTRQKEKDFETLVIEDGSTVTCEAVCALFANSLDLHYFLKANSGPGQSRNYGAQRAKGAYLIILDSDVVLPEDYLQIIDRQLAVEQPDAFGGPDRAHSSFTDVQKAISYSMTSFFTTGGIRGGKKKMDTFYPRSFNMGVRRDVYQKLGGFSSMRFGEDIDFSIRLIKAGYNSRLFSDAWVWHKRRTDFRKFFRQVFNSGMARINLYKKYPDSLKLVHLLPMIFTVGVAALILLTIIMNVIIRSAPDNDLNMLVTSAPLIPVALYAIIIFAHSSIVNRGVKVGALSVVAAFIQLCGYGLGFIKAWWIRCVLRRGDDSLQAFKRNFYK